MLLSTLTPALWAQSATHQTAKETAVLASLPLRNLQIEVRQVVQKEAAQDQVAASGASQRASARVQVRVSLP